MDQQIVESIGPVGSRCTVTIEKVFAYGAFVRLADGTKGHIRRREMTWQRNIVPSKVVHVGQQIEVIILGYAEHHKRVELSHRLTLPNPWQAFVATYQEGDVVEASVKDLLPSGLFAEIMPGVDGFIPSSWLAPWPIEAIGQQFWIADRVKAIITHIDNERETVRLSIRRYMARQSTVQSVMSYLEAGEVSGVAVNAPDVDPLRARYKECILPKQVDLATARRVGSILVVEDEAALRKSLVAWLRTCGYEVFGAHNVAAAIEQIQMREFNVCFVDLELPDQDGFAFIDCLKRLRHGAHAVLMTGSDWLTERAQEIEQAGVVTVLIKPLNLNEVDVVLRQISYGSEHLLQRPQTAKPAVASSYHSFQKLTHMMRSKISLQQRLEQGLKHVFELTRAEVGIIFYLDPTSQMISIKAQMGENVLNGDALFLLNDSPVKDVLREGKPVFETNIRANSQRRFLKLLDLLPFCSCIGVPIGDDVSSDYALFLFHQKRRAFNRYRLYDAQSVASLLTIALQSHTLEQRIEAVSGILFGGQLAASFGHEVSNKISALEIQIRNLQYSLTTVNQGDVAEQQAVMLDIETAQNDVMRTVIDLKDTVHLFQNLSKPDVLATVNANQVVQQTIALLQPIFSKERVTIGVNLASALPFVSGSVIRLQQVLLNIMLNGTQHMGLSEGNQRKLNISTEVVNDRSFQVIKISINDTGMGIHKKLWRKIFDLGYSTRSEGTGLGLFIARNLVESMAGRIYVEQSYILIGTTFVVELPITGGGKL